MLNKIIILLLLSSCSFKVTQDKEIEKGIVDNPVTLNTNKIIVEDLEDEQELTPLEDAKRRMELKLLELQVEINTESQWMETGNLRLYILRTLLTKDKYDKLKSEIDISIFQNGAREIYKTISNIYKDNPNI